MKTDEKCFTSGAGCSKLGLDNPELLPNLKSDLNA